jgi:hypothetical protein
MTIIIAAMKRTLALPEKGLSKAHVDITDMRQSVWI